MFVWAQEQEVELQQKQEQELEGKEAGCEACGHVAVKSVQ